MKKRIRQDQTDAILAGGSAELTVEQVAHLVKYLPFDIPLRVEKITSSLYEVRIAKETP